MALILSVDPGSSVGFVTVNTDEPLKLIMAGQLPPSDFVAWVHDILVAIDEVVCEKFIISARTLKSLGSGVQDTIDVEGWVRLECGRREIPFTDQRNGDVLAFATDEKLKALDWWDLGQTRSNRDVRSAARHMLKYLVDHGYLKPVDLPVNLG